MKIVATSTLILAALAIQSADAQRKGKGKGKAKGRGKGKGANRAGTPLDFAAPICHSKSRSQYCQAKLSAERAGANGAEAVINMVRTNICRVFHPTRKINKCPVRNSHVDAMIRNYGCNCFPENFDDLPQTVGGKKSWNMGRNGKPIDPIDAACGKLRDAYTCVTFDVENAIYPDPDPSSPDEQDKCGRQTIYDYHIDNDKNVICGPVEDPEYANSDPSEECRKVVCNIERQFADEVFSHIGGDVVAYQDDNPGKYDVFSDSSICVSGNNGNAVSECCGTYPSRVPFIPFIRTCCDMGNGVFEAKYVGDC